MPSENQFFLDEGVTGLQSVSGFVGYLALTDLIKNQSIGVPQGTLHTLVWIFE